MGRKKLVEENQEELQPIRRAIDPEGRENQLIALAINCVEQRLRNNTASAQEVCFYLKLGTQEKKLEMEKLRNENALLAKKVEVLDSQKRTEELYADAIKAMRVYSGARSQEDTDS